MAAISSSGSSASIHSDSAGMGSPPNMGPLGFVERFLKVSEMETFAEWKEVVTDKSFSNFICGPIFSFIASMIPENIAPNVLSLTGSLLIAQSWYFCSIYMDGAPDIVNVLSVTSIFIFWALGGIDGRHAKKTMNDSPLGELFKYVCDIISTVFLMCVLCELSGAHGDMVTQWYCVQLGQLVLLVKHHSAYCRNAGLRYWFVGPGEVLMGMAGLLLVRYFMGLDWMLGIYEHSLGMIASALTWTGMYKSVPVVRMLYFFGFLSTCLRIWVSSYPSKHTFSRQGLLVILFFRAIPAGFFVLVGDTGNNSLTARDVICDGLFMGVVTTDLIVSKMAGRQIHTLVVIMGTVIVPHLQLVTFMMVFFYYVSVFWDLTNYMNLPLLVSVRNVYCDGVYDMCHIGHKNLFRNALKFGNRLFVGVCGDEDCAKYKRPPVMSAAEREAEVSNCKCVTKVIHNAPTFGLTKEFLDKHRIHVVAFGAEYQERYPDPKDDPYYGLPRKMGIARPLPRSEGMSTSDLIKRITEMEKI